MIDLKKLAEYAKNEIRTDAQFAIIDPNDLLKLIAVVRAARDYWQVYAINEACALPEINRREKELETALENLK
jgi:hypothetical protein